MVPPKDTLIPGACESGTLNGKKKKKDFENVIKNLKVIMWLNLTKSIL